MKRKFNHNASLIRELYGREFSLMNLLNENVFADKDVINFLTTAYIKYVEKDGKAATSLSKIGGPFETQLKKRHPELSMGEAIAFLTKLDALAEKDPDVIDMAAKGTSGSARAPYERLAARVAASLSKSNKRAPGGSQTQSAKGKKTPSKKGKSRKKKGNELVKKIQEIIDPGQEFTSHDGFWGSKTDEAWFSWVDKNKAKINKLIVDEAKHLDVSKPSVSEDIDAVEVAERAAFTRNIQGVYDLCLEVGIDQQPPEGNNQKDPPTSPQPKTPKTTGWPAVRDGKRLRYGEKFGNQPVVALLKKGELPVEWAFTIDEYKSAMGKHPKDNFQYNPDNAGSNANLLNGWAQGIGNKEYLTTWHNSSENPGAVAFLKSQKYTSSAVLIYDDKNEILYLDAAGYDDAITTVKIKDGKYFYISDMDFNPPKGYYDNLKEHSTPGYGESRGSLYRKRYYGRY